MKSDYEAVCQRILADDRDLAGVSYRKLDCGCMQFCGISPQGETLGCRHHVSGQPPTRNLEPLVCLKCRKDEAFAVERTVEKGIFWATNPPEPEVQAQIRLKVLGPGDSAQP